MTIAIIDYGTGNLTSVKNALSYLGADSVLTANADQIRSADGAILPGVGAFGAGMKQLKALNLDTIIKSEFSSKTKPFLGICLGMQLLFDTSDEHGHYEGLGLVSGTVERLSDAHKGIRVPHIGWNQVEPVKAQGLFKHQPEGEAFYFVHSHVVKPQNHSVIASWSEHGDRFVSSLEDGLIWAAQFHPEKSHKAGLGLLKSWLEMVYPC